jgi:hypothetical protein
VTPVNTERYGLWYHGSFWIKILIT